MVVKQTISPDQRRTQTLNALQSTVLGSYALLALSFERSLLAQNKSPRTVETYLEAVTQLGYFLSERGMPTELHNIRREHVEAFISYLLTKIDPRRGRTLRPATASNRFKSLQAFFKWAEEEGEIKVSPMARMKPPHV